MITGLGVATALGCSVDHFWSNIVKGKTGITKIKKFEAAGLKNYYGGKVKEIDLPEKYVNLSGGHRLGVVAASGALEDSTFDRISEIGLILGISGSSTGEVLEAKILEGKDTGFKDHLTVDFFTANLGSALGLGGPFFTLSCACASGNYAMSFAYERIKRGQNTAMLAGGVHSLSLSVFLGFRSLLSIAPLACQPFDKNRRGLIPAEGAGFLVLENLQSAKKRNAHIYAEILGYGMSSDAYHPVRPSRDSIFFCLQDSLRAAGVNAGDIDYVNAHGTGTRQNDAAECAAIKRLFGRGYRKIPVSSVKSMLGHTMEAASAIESVVSALILEKGVISPTINYETFDPECDIDCVPNFSRKQKVNLLMNNSFGFGGINCTLVMKRY